MLVTLMLSVNVAHAQVNLALGKSVTGSTGSTNLGNLVDGNFNTVAKSGNVQTGTNSEWFLIDLGADYFIENVVIGANPASQVSQDRMRRFLIASWPSTVAGPTGLGRQGSNYISGSSFSTLFNRLVYQDAAGIAPNTPSTFDVGPSGSILGPPFTDSKFSLNFGIHKARYVIILNLQRDFFDPSEIQVFQSVAGSVRIFNNGGFENQSFGSSSLMVRTPEGLMTGWSTTEIVGSTQGDPNGVLSNGLPPKNGGLIDIWPSGIGGSIVSKAGTKHAELNSVSNGMLEQQPICVLTGESFTWSFAHRGRNGADVMALRINDIDVANFTDNNATAGTHQANLLAGGVGTTTIKVGTTTLSTVGNINSTADVNGWTQWTGTWTNTTGSSKQVTFAFRAVSSVGGDISAGNFIDEVSLTSLSALASLNTSLGTRAGIGPEFRATANLPKIRLQGNISAAGSIQLAITGGTATRGVDYTTKLTPGGPISNSGNITIPIPAGVYDGSDATAISLAPYISVLRDAITPEPDETIIGTLINPVGLVVIGDAGACTTSNTAGAFDYTITDTPPITIAITPSNVSCFGGNNGKATPNISGGSGSYTYSWNTIPVQTTAVAVNLVPGTYTLTVTDAISGEVNTGDVTITQPTSALGSTGAITDASGSTVSDGAVNLTVTGGTASYTYLWSNNATTEDVTGLMPATYTVNITDANGCSTTSTFIVRGAVSAINVTAPNKINNESTGTTIPSLMGTDGDGTVTSYRVTTLPPSTQGSLTLADGTSITTSTVLTPTQAAGIKFVPNNTYVGPVNFNFTATDNDGLSDPTPATYTLTVGSPPVSTNTTNPAPISNQSTGTTISPLASSDANDGGTTASYTINTLPTPAQGTLTLGDGTVVSVGQILTPAQASSLKFTPAPMYVGPGNFTFSATDNDGFTDSIPATYTFNVVRPSSDLAIVKTANPKPAIAGQGLTYTISLTNNGPGSLQAIDALTLTDNLPAGFTATSYNASAGTYNSTNGNWTGLTLSTGQNATVTIAGNVASSATGTLNNTANLTLPATITDPTPANNTATNVTNITSKPVLVVAKTGAASLIAGNIATYNIKVTNTGAGNAVGATITDVVPNTLTGVTWTSNVTGTATVMAGATGSGNNVALTVNIPAGIGNEINVVIKGTVSTTAEGSISNTATATPVESAGTAGTSTQVANITSSPGVNISKSAPAAANAGDNITYVIEVGNNGPSNAVAINIADVVPTGIGNVTWTASTTGNASITSGATGTGSSVALVGNIDAGTTNKISIVVKGTVSASFTGVLNNTATATPSETGTQVVTATANTSVTAIPIFSITKSGPATLKSGSSITYKINVKNTGLSNSTATVITDVVSSSIVNPIWAAVVKSGTATITAGASGTGNNVLVTANTTAGSEIEITVSGSVAANFGGNITNVAKVTPEEPGAKETTSTISTSVERVPTLTIQKNGPATIKAGQPINYTITVANTSTADALAAVITDAIPATIVNPSWTSSTTGTATVTAGASGNTASLSLTGNIPAGATNTIIVNVSGTVATSQTANLVNSATVTPSEIGATPATSSPVTTAVTSKPDIVLNKTGPATAFSGQRVTYQIDAINNGPSDATNLAITDAVPATLTNVSWTATVNGTSTISAGATGTGNAVSITSNLKVGNANKLSIIVQGDTAANQANVNIANKATATPGEPGTAPVNSNTVNTAITQKNKVTVVKSGPTEISTGETISYTLLVKNEGPSNAIGTVITDAVNAGITNVTWTTATTGTAVVTAGASGAVNNVNVTGNIPAGNNNSILITINGKVSASFAGASITNMATATPSEPGNPPVTSNTVTTNIAKIANLNITKTGPQTAVAGENVSYKITVNNIWPSNVVGAIIQDIVPASIINTTWTAIAQGTATVSAASGTGNAINLTANLSNSTTDKIIITISGKIDPTFTGTTINNTATASPPAGTIDPTPASASAITAVSALANVYIIKSGPATIDAGAPITYVVKVVNEGLTTATNTHILDNLSALNPGANWLVSGANGATVTSPATGSGNIDVVANIPKGGTVEITINGIVPSTLIAGATLTNTASVVVDSAIKDLTTIDDIATADTKINGTSNYTISKTGPSSIKVGDVISYTINAENKGATSITGALINDILPVGLINATWTVSGSGGANPTVTSGSGNISLTEDLPANGGRITIVITATVSGAVDNSIVNQATLQVAPDAPIISEKTTAVIKAAEVSVSKSGPATVVAGDNITYTLIARNYGREDILNMKIQDDVPSVIQNVSWTAVLSGASSFAAGGSSSGTGSVNLPVNIPAGEANFVTITINGNVLPGAPAGGFTNTASLDLNASGGVTDFNLANNTSTVNTNILSSPVLRVEKTGPLNAGAGNTVNYKIKVKNIGLSNAIGATIADVVPASITTTSWTTSVEGTAVIGTGATGTGNNVSLTGNIPAGDNNAIVVNVSGIISPSFAGTINNTASATIGADPPVKSNTISTLVGATSNLTIVKNAPATISAGQVITYTIQVNNTGPSNLRGSAITDNIPAILTNVNWTSIASGGAIITSGNTGTGNALSLVANLPANGQVLVNVTGRVPNNGTGNITNNATITPAEAGVAPVTSTDAVTAINSVPHLVFSKATPTNIGAGENITYTLILQNTGPSDAINTAITDVVPSDVIGVTWIATASNGASVVSGNSGTTNTVNTVVNVPVGTKIDIKITGKVSPTFAGNLVNTATATPSEAGATVINQSATTQVGKKIALVISKSAPANLTSGQVITYQIRVKNNGPSNSTNTIITDSVPANVQVTSWNAVANGIATINGANSGTTDTINVSANIPTGTTDEIVITVNGTVSASLVGTLSNTATATPSEAGATTVNATATTNITRSPILKIDKTGLATTTAGSAITYQLKISNTGLSDAVAAVISDAVPAGITNVSWTTSVAGTATIAANGTGTGNAVSLTANLPAGAANIVTVNITGTVDATTMGNLLNKATASPTEPGASPATSPEVQTAIKPTGTADTDRTMIGTAKTINVRNNDGTASTYPVFKDSDPAHGGVIINADGTITYTPTAGYTGTDSFTYRLRDPNGILSDPITVTVTVYAASYTVNKVAAATIVNVVGDVINYTLTVTNTGGSVLNNIVITDAGADANSITPANITSLAIGASTTVTAKHTLVKADVDAASYSNQATASGKDENGNTITATSDDPNVVGTTNPTVKAINSPPSVTLVKTAPATANAGGAISYIIEVGNTGPTNATATSITDIVPATITNVSWSAAATGAASISSGAIGTGSNVAVVGNIAKGTGNKITITVNGIVSPSFSGTLNNTAKATPTEVGTTEITSSASTVVQRTPVLTIQKSGPASIKAGQTIAYTITIANTSSADAIAAVITDAIPASILNPSWTSNVTGTATVTTGATGSTSNLSLTGNIPAGAGNTIVLTVSGTVNASQIANVVNNAKVTPAETGTTAVTSTDVTTTVTREPSIVLNKTGPATVFAGKNVTYQIDVVNNGPSNAANLPIADVVPAQLTNVSWTATASGTSTLSAGATGTGNSVAVTGDLKVGNANKVSIVITGSVAPGQAASTITNTATATPVETGVAVNSNTVNTAIISKNAVIITKSGPATINAGENITYTLLVGNTGPSSAIGTEIKDAIDSRLTNVSWITTLGGTATVNSGATGTGNTVSVTGTIPPGAANTILVTITGKVLPAFAGASLANTATAAPAEAGSTEVTSNTITTAVSKVADLKITKTGPQTGTAGGSISYTLTVNNAGPSNVTAAEIKDIVPAGIINTTWTAVAQGAATVSAANGTGNAINLTGDLTSATADKIVITVTGTIDPTFTGASISNTATATPSSGITDPTPATANSTTNVNRIADLTITKTAPANAGAGEGVEYILHVTNNGLTTAINTHIVDDLSALVAGATWSAVASAGATITTPTTGSGNIDLTASIPNAGVIDVTIKGTIPPGALAGSTLSNTASVDIDPAITDSNPAENSATVTTDIRTNNNYRISKSGPSSIKIGDVITYTIIVENTGLGDITGALIKDTLPTSLSSASWTATGAHGAVPSSASGTGNIDITGDLPASTGKITIVVTATVISTVDNSIVNTATVQVLPDDPISSAKTTTIIKTADVSIVKTGPATVVAGDDITYTLTARNNGPADVSNMIIRDVLPTTLQNATWTVNLGGTATLGATGTLTGTGDVTLPVNIPVGTANVITVVITAKVKANAIAGTMNNNASLDLTNTGGVNDVNLSDNSSNISTTITAEPVLAVEKIGQPTANAGGAINYTVKVKNTGLSDAVGAAITDLVPAAVTNISWTSSVEGTAVINSGATGTGNNVSLAGNIPAGANAILINISGIVNPAFRGTLSNTASAAIGAGTAVQSPVVSTVVATVAKLTIVKNAPPSIIAGNTITYTIQVNNAGPSNLLGSSITDVVPADLTNVTWSSTSSGGATITSGATGTGNNLAMVANVPVNGQVLVMVTGLVAPDATAAINNTATVAPAEPGLLPISSNITVTQVKSVPNLVFSKIAPTTVSAGQAITYVLTLENTGPSSAINTAISDIVPNGVTVASWTTTSSNGASVVSGGNGTNNNTVNSIVNVPVGGRIELTIQGTVSPTFTGNLVNNATATPSESGTTPVSATATTQVSAKVGLVITKTAPLSINSGQLITYQIIVKNNGPSNSINTIITDNVPANVIVGSWSAVANGTAIINGTNSGNTNVVSVSANIPTGTANQIVITVNGNVNSVFMGTVTNIATAVPSEAGSATATASATTNISRTPTLQIEKTGLTTATPGSTITYQLKVSNIGVSDALAAVIADAVPVGISNVSWTTSVGGTASIVANGSGTNSNVSLTVNIPAGAANTVTVNITGTVTANTTGYLVNKATVTPAEPAATVATSLEVQTAVKPVGTADVEHVLIGTSKTIGVKTNDANSSTYTVIKDSDPSHGTITVNTDGTITYIPTAGYIGNDTFTYRLQSPEGILSDPITVTLIVYNASFTVTKVANSTNVSVAGDVINYTLTVTNTGESVLSNVVVTDAGAESITPANITTLDIGASVILTAIHTLTLSEVNSGSYSNQASATGIDQNGNNITTLSDDPNVVGPNNPTVKVITPLVESPGITVVKSGMFNDINGDGLAELGETITYNFTLTNTGNVSLSSVTVSDPKVTVIGGPVSLAPGAVDSTSFRAVYTISQGDVDAGFVTNTASVTGTTPAGTVSDISGTASDNDVPTVTTLHQLAGLKLTKDGVYQDTNSDGVVNIGDSILFTFAVENTGTVPVTNIRITDPMVSVTGGPLSNLPPGIIDNSTFKAVYNLTAQDLKTGAVYNSAIADGEDGKGNSVMADSKDPSPIDPNDPNYKPACPDCTVVSLKRKSAIALIKQAVFNDNNGDGIAQAGETLIYSFTIINTGDVTVTGITIADPLPGIVMNGGPITLLAGETDTATFTGVYAIKQSDINAGTVINQATVSGVDSFNNTVSDVSDNADENGNNPTATLLSGCTIKVFNALSINGDGLNDTFYVAGIDCYPDNEVTIYNRWGIEVYHAEGYNNKDRVFRGYSEGRVTVAREKKLPSGTYFYVLRYKKNDGSVQEKSGYMNLN